MNRRDEPGDVHVLPNDHPHQESCDCWCEPELDTPASGESSQVWVHRVIQ